MLVCKTGVLLCCHLVICTLTFLSTAFTMACYDNVHRLCLHACTSFVEIPRHGGNEHCDKCSCAAVQIEVHVLFHFEGSFVCPLIKKYSFSFFLFVML